VILLEVGLERRGPVVRLVAQGSAGAGHQIGIIVRHAALAATHAPEDHGDGTQEDSTADATDHTADDLLVGVAEAAAAPIALLGAGQLSGYGGASGADGGPGSDIRGQESLAAADEGNNGGDGLEFGGDQGRSPRDRGCQF